MYKKIFIVTIIISIILMFLYLYIFTSLFGHPSEGFRDFKNYSLGDCIINEKINTYLNRKLYRFYFRDSIGDQYYRKTKKIFDYDVLNEVVNENLGLSEDPPKDSLVIHLRIGDVADWEYSGPIEDALLGKDGDYGYLKTYDYFKKNVEKLKKYNISKIILVGGYHTKEDHSRSEEYVDKIKKFLEKNNFNIHTRINQKSPDEDFIYMAKSQYFLKTGGNYSTIINKIVEMRNGITLEK